MYRIVFWALLLSMGSFIFNIQLMKGIINKMRKIVTRFAQFSFIIYIPVFPLYSPSSVDVKYLAGYVIVLE